MKTSVFGFLPIAIKTPSVLNSDFSDQLGVSTFATLFPDRYFRFGLGVGNMVSASVGFNARGKIPVIIGLSDLLLAKAFDQVYNGIAVPNLNIKILVAKLSGTGFNDVEDQKLAELLPNFEIMNSSNDEQLHENLERAILDYGPKYLRV